MHLLVDISAHGLGHLAQTAPVIKALQSRLPSLRLTLRSALPRVQLERYLTGNFAHVHEARDFGFAMHNAMDIDLPASARAYHDFHQNWRERIDIEAAWIKAKEFTAVLTNVAYLPLAAAARAGLPSASVSSINWADLFIHYFAAASWAAKIHGEILSAYRDADCFLRASPGLPMADLNRRREIGPIARLGKRDRGAISREMNIAEGNRWVLLAMGGMDFRLPVESWASAAGVNWIVPAAWQVRRDNVRAFDNTRINFADMLASVDAVITKPGYGVFVEAACNGIPVLYARRDDWPETPYLSAWLATHARACAISRNGLMKGEFIGEMAHLWRTRPPAVPLATGAGEAAELLQTVLRLH
jgi:hypothetical protein